MSSVQFAGDGNYYALLGSCSNGGHDISRWNASSWVTLSSCYASLSVAADGGGQFVAIDPNGTVWLSTSYGSSGWYKPSVPSGTYLSATSISTSLGTYALVRNDHTVWRYNGSSWTQIAGITNASMIDADDQGVVYVLGTDGYVYHYSGSGSSWDKLNGSGGTFLANGGSIHVWTIGTVSSGNSIYRFPDTGIQHTRSISGSITCNVPPPYNQQICNPAVHTVKLSAGLGSTFGTQTQYSFSGPGSWGAQASVNKNDFFDCLENAADCAPATSGTVTCSQAGQIYSDVLGGSWSISLGVGTYKYSSVAGGRCTYTLACPSGTTFSCSASTLTTPTPCPSEYMIQDAIVFKSGSTKICFFVGVAVPSPVPVACQ